MAYGVHPGWVHYSRGLGLIMLARRLQWPMIALSLALCIALLALIISGKRRAWWLIGLAPVLTLFGHRFVTAPVNHYSIVDEPAFVAADQAKFVRDEDTVVGVVFNEQPFAYPCSVLYYEPVIVQSDREKRMLLVWNGGANVAAAVPATRELKARELDIVSDPADSLLLYNGRTGQFIVGLTGRLRDGGKASGTEGESLPVSKQSWRRWRSDHPETKVMVPSGGKLGPGVPVRGAADDRVVLVGPALAVCDADITTTPLNVTSGDVPVVIFREKATGRSVAFDRHVEADLIPRFTLNHEAKRKTAFMIDSDTNTGWNAAGIAVDGPDRKMRGHKLTPVDVQEDVSWSAASFWLRGLKLHSPTPTTKPAS
jgi:Protein of unknown function (DUF3179)